MEGFYAVVIFPLGKTPGRSCLFRPAGGTAGRRRRSALHGVTTQINSKSHSISNRPPSHAPPDPPVHMHSTHAILAPRRQPISVQLTTGESSINQSINQGFL